MKIAVFCGSSKGNDPLYENEAKKLGEFFAKNEIELVYGGGIVGLMGIISTAVMQNGGSVYGVIPEHLQNKELAHHGLTELHIVKDMHTRKAMMANRADAFVAMPGGAGTLEEIFEVWTWLQIGYHQKPCALYNVGGFYDKLIEFIEHIVKSNFLDKKYLDTLIIEDTPQGLLQALKEYKTPKSKWS